MTLRLAPMATAARKLRCCDIKYSISIIFSFQQALPFPTPGAPAQPLCTAYPQRRTVFLLDPGPNANGYLTQLLVVEQSGGLAGLIGDEPDPVRGVTGGKRVTIRLTR
jgi:hypothetical protein